MTDRESLFSALRYALDEDRGRLVVALYDLDEADLERLIDAAQLIDSEGQGVLELIYAQNAAPPSWQMSCTCSVTLRPNEPMVHDKSHCPIHGGKS